MLTSVSFSSHVVQRASAESGEVRRLPLLGRWVVADPRSEVADTDKHLARLEQRLRHCLEVEPHIAVPAQHL